MFELVAHPFLNVRLGLEWFLVIPASLAHQAIFVVNEVEMLSTKMEAAAVVTVDVAAPISEAAMDLFVATRMVTNRWNTVANISMPIAVVSDRPAHAIISAFRLWNS